MKNSSNSDVIQKYKIKWTELDELASLKVYLDNPNNSYKVFWNNFLQLNPKSKVAYRSFVMKIQNWKYWDADYTETKGLKGRDKLGDILNQYKNNIELLNTTINKITTKNYISTELVTDLKAISDQNISETQKLLLQYARLGQGKFRDDLFIKYNGKCVLSNINKDEFLIASHILPWSQSNNKQRLDPNNGLLLNKFIDALFDKFLISFDEKGFLVIKHGVNNSSLFESYLFENIISKKESIHNYVSKETILYLKKHYEIFLSKN